MSAFLNLKRDPYKDMPKLEPPADEPPRPVPIAHPAIKQEGGNVKQEAKEPPNEGGNAPSITVKKEKEIVFKREDFIGKDEYEIKAMMLNAFKPHIAAPALQKKKLYAHTTRIHHKPLLQPNASDLYTKNTAPGKTILSHFNEAPMTDTAGRRYVRLRDTGNFFAWPRLRTILDSLDFIKGRDEIYFVRPAPGMCADGDLEPNVPFPEDDNHPMTFYIRKPDSKRMDKYTGVITQSGVDELVDRTHQRHRRATSWVVVRDLAPLKAGSG